MWEQLLLGFKLAPLNGLNGKVANGDIEKGIPWKNSFLISSYGIDYGQPLSAIFTKLRLHSSTLSPSLRASSQKSCSECAVCKIIENRGFGERINQSEAYVNRGHMHKLFLNKQGFWLIAFIHVEAACWRVWMSSVSRRIYARQTQNGESMFPLRRCDQHKY